MNDTDKLVAAIFAATMCVTAKTVKHDDFLNQYEAFRNMIHNREQVAQAAKARLSAAMKALKDTTVPT